MAKGKLLGGASRRSILQQFGAAAVGISFAGGLSACGGGDRGPTVNFYNWDTYIGPTTLEDFQAASGTSVNMSLFATNDELFARLRAGNPGFDVIVPSNEYVTRMSQAQMIQELDHSKIPNMANLLPEFQDASFDPGRRYSMPYTWLVLGIGYNKAAVRAKGLTVPDSWKYLFDDATFNQKMALLSESADLIRLSAKYLGHSVNGIPPAMLTQIEQMLIRQKPRVKQFHSDNGQDLACIRRSGHCARVQWRHRAADGGRGRRSVRFRRAEGRHADQFGLPVHPDRRAATSMARTPSSTICSTPKPGRRSLKRSSTRRQMGPRAI